MSSAKNAELTVLIADEKKIRRVMIKEFLKDNFIIEEACSGDEVLEKLKAGKDSYALLLLDAHMQTADGPTVLSCLSQSRLIDDIPVILITDETDPDTLERAYAYGVCDYINPKNGRKTVKNRVDNVLIAHRKQQDFINIINGQLLEQEYVNHMMLAIFSQILGSRNAESRDHILHIGLIVNLILKCLMKKETTYRLTPKVLEEITLASTLHDIGKIRVEEAILNKEGPLTQAEFESLKKHPQAGAAIIEDLLEDYPESRFLRCAHDICRWHHERYDGTGYPDELLGDTIPISAQAVAIADVYDALTSKRSYKEAYSHAQALRMIADNECGVFNPLLVESLFEAGDEIQSLLQKPRKDQSRIFFHLSRLTETMAPSASSYTTQLLGDLDNEREKNLFLSDRDDEVVFTYERDAERFTSNKTGASFFGFEDLSFRPNELFQEGTPGASALKAEIVNRMDHPGQNYSTEFTVDGLEGAERYELKMHALAAREDGEAAGMIGRMKKIGKTDLKNKGSRKEPHPIFTQETQSEKAMSADEARRLLLDLSLFSDEVHLIEPHTKRLAEIDPAGKVRLSGIRCHSLYENSGPCEHCDVLDPNGECKKSFYAMVGSRLYSVNTLKIRVDGSPYTVHARDLISEQDEDLGESNLLPVTHEIYKDPMTRCHNEVYLTQRLADRPYFGAVCFDLDRFSLVNETYGHRTGDMIIQETARILQARTSIEDELIRLGGDEFALFLKDEPKEGLETFSESLRLSVEEAVRARATDLHITVTAGFIKGPDLSYTLLNRAQGHLSRNKRKPKDARMTKH